MKLDDIESAIESILFVSGTPVDLQSLSKSIGHDAATTKKFVATLKDKLEAENHGITIAEIDGAYQIGTVPKNIEYLKKAFAETKKQELTQPLLETLAIIAYKQPITKAEIESIRGVNADHAVNRLLEKNLVKEVGRSSAPGKPILFGTTDEFLRSFGFRNASEISNIYNKEWSSSG